MKSFGRWGVVVAIVCAVLMMTLAAAPGWAQSFRGTIQGTVTDSSGAALVGATVTVHNIDTGVDRITNTTTDGGYLMPELPVGTYDVIVEMSGFQKSKVAGVAVAVAAERRVDGALQPGQVNQQIVVSGEEVPVVETSSDTLGGTFESSAVEDLPINGRDYTKMLILVPGATGAPRGAERRRRFSRLLRPVQREWQPRPRKQLPARWHGHERRLPEPAGHQSGRCIRHAGHDSTGRFHPGIERAVEHGGGVRQKFRFRGEYHHQERRQYIRRQRIRRFQKRGAERAELFQRGGPAKGRLPE